MFNPVMRKPFYSLALSLACFLSSAAQNQSPLQGEYYLRGVMETASGFKLNRDSTFEFFYSYGALDRNGSGTWKQVGNTVIFNSLPQPPHDFALVRSEKVPGNLSTFRIVDNNEMLLRYVDVIFENGKAVVKKTTDSKGLIEIPKQPIDSLALLFTLCPDRYSVFPVSDKEHNYFEFRFEPWIVEVFFKNFILKVDKSNLAGKHPLLTGELFTYEKSSKN
jgi:hypothetical protein